MSKVASISSWTQKRKTRDLLLPSGTTVKIVENHLLPLITNSLMPLTLLSRVQKIEPPKDGSVSEDQAKIVEGYNKLLTLITELIVEPAVTLSDLAQIPGEDLQFLFSYLMRGREVAALSSFRPGTGSNTPGSDVPPVQEAAV